MTSHDLWILVHHLRGVSFCVLCQRSIEFAPVAQMSHQKIPLLIGTSGLVGSKNYDPECDGCLPRSLSFDGIGIFWLARMIPPWTVQRINYNPLARIVLPALFLSFSDVAVCGLRFYGSLFPWAEQILGWLSPQPIGVQHADGCLSWIHRGFCAPNKSRDQKRPSDITGPRPLTLTLGAVTVEVNIWPAPTMIRTLLPSWISAMPWTFVERLRRKCLSVLGCAAMGRVTGFPRCMGQLRTVSRVTSDFKGMKMEKCLIFMRWRWRNASFSRLNEEI